MNPSKALEGLRRSMGRAQLRARGNAPTALTYIGIGALLAASVFAVKATPKVEPIVEELEENLSQIENLSPTVMDEEQRSVAKAKVYMHTGFQLAKAYAIPATLAIGGTAAILYSHGIMKKRNAALLAAYGVLERGYAAYRERIRKSFGEELEEQVYRGHTVKLEDVKDGVIEWDVREEKPAGSEYSVEFGPMNRNWNFVRPEYNLVFLRSQERYLNELLKRRGHVLLNDVYDAIGEERTRAGMVVGWTWHTNFDGYISFSLPEPGSPEEQDYIQYFAGETPLLLDFNVDGLIMDYLK